jgi:hemoglobin-like flavoprotein
MTPESIRCVRASLTRIEPDLAALGSSFYRHLFELAPEVRGMFPSRMADQADKLVAMLASIVRALDQPDQLAQVFAQMGCRHAGYGVAEAHYDAVGAALLRALRACLGDEAWTPRLADAWAEIYGEMAEAMIAAAGAPEADPGDDAAGESSRTLDPGGEPSR